MTTRIVLSEDKLDWLRFRALMTGRSVTAYVDKVLEDDLYNAPEETLAAYEAFQRALRESGQNNGE